MKTDELREKYLEYFVAQGHRLCPSDVLVPRWDKSVLFTPAGMNQFKDHFLGAVELEYTRATSCQKCLRTGDIENVGRTAYHHTFFEMLGNFSFGDYFKREAILWAWDFLTNPKYLAIDPERLSVTVLPGGRRIGQDLVRRSRRQTADPRGGRRKLLAGIGTERGAGWRVRPLQRNLLYAGRWPGSGNLELGVLPSSIVRGILPTTCGRCPARNIDTGMGLERIAGDAARREHELPHRYPAAAGRSSGGDLRHEI